MILRDRFMYILFGHIHMHVSIYTITDIFCPPNKHRPSKPLIRFMSLVKRSICVLPG